MRGCCISLARPLGTRNRIVCVGVSLRSGQNHPLRQLSSLHGFRIYRRKLQKYHHKDSLQVIESYDRSHAHQRESCELGSGYILALQTMDRIGYRGFLVTEPIHIRPSFSARCFYGIQL
ncbi:uncharacterized protein BDZ83DRAFT_604986 [Colletotrichum acutatum]|uniref:Uncharacterized protein n=1 Tax=Glomerella acutata TaxID=27357 RepID=A0AAD8XLU7_GLOAC|nr:uncharacterized protein BDZ83DRAFT_604986 [Colletotrichum acutatum]KAK1729800.1 hypothetical protein BDZ83DRAFT_604986 [Colletotrichum acutatum]